MFRMYLPDDYINGQESGQDQIVWMTISGQTHFYISIPSLCGVYLDHNDEQKHI